MSLDGLSLIDLSAWADVQSGDTFAVVKSYFDGGNQADYRQYKTITLCGIAGSDAQWKAFEQRWVQLVKSHGADYVHTTDLLTLNEPYTKDNGWTPAKAQALLSDCATRILEHRANPEFGHDFAEILPLAPISHRLHGIMPVSVTMLLDDYRRVSEEMPNIQPPEHHCALGCLALCGQWADLLEIQRMQLIFDRNETFMRHLYERWKSKKAKQHEATWRHISAITEADSEDVPGLQAADLIAWCIGAEHRIGIQYEWQQRILDRHRGPEAEFFDEARIRTVDVDYLKQLKEWGIPQRKPFR